MALATDHQRSDHQDDRTDQGREPASAGPGRLRFFDLDDFPGDIHRFSFLGIQPKQRSLAEGEHPVEGL